jgi:protein tyrosine phosphatase
VSSSPRWEQTTGLKNHASPIPYDILRPLAETCGRTLSMSEPRARFVCELQQLAAVHPGLVERCMRALNRETAKDFLKLQVLQNDLSSSLELHTETRDLHKNRYKDVLPYRESRILLKSGGYVNASPILDDRSVHAAGENRATYIACQGPLQHTVESFWEMVVERQVRDVVMLTGLVEQGREKCFNYFEDGVIGKYRIKCTQRSSARDVSVRHLEIHAGPTMHCVRHHQLMTWPDHGVPASPNVLDPLLDVLYENFKDGLTTVVHCSAGIGRSGVLIALGILVARLDKMLRGEIAVDDDRLCNFVDIVGGMRRQRAGMVQTATQYAFCIAAAQRLLSMLLPMPTAPI